MKKITIISLLSTGFIFGMSEKNQSNLGLSEIEMSSIDIRNIQHDLVNPLKQALANSNDFDAKKALAILLTIEANNQLGKKVSPVLHNQGKINYELIKDFCPDHLNDQLYFALAKTKPDQNS